MLSLFTDHPREALCSALAGREVDHLFASLDRQELAFVIAGCFPPTGLPGIDEWLARHHPALNRRALQMLPAAATRAERPYEPYRAWRSAQMGYFARILARITPHAGFSRRTIDGLLTRIERERALVLTDRVTYLHFNGRDMLDAMLDCIQRNWEATDGLREDMLACEMR